MNPLTLSHVIAGSTSSASSIPLMILHGLFGSKQNWRSLSKSLSTKLSTSVVSVDLRNHGESPHSPVHTFDAMSADVGLLLDTLKMGRWILWDIRLFDGIRRGGKTAMHYALLNQERVRRLVVVDTAPSHQIISSAYAGYVQQLGACIVNGIFMSMRKVSAANIKTLSEADAILSETIKDKSVRQFLLTNHKETHDGTLQFRVNLDALAEYVDKDIADFPLITSGVIFTKPTLFVRGLREGYITKKSEKDIKVLFPNSIIVDIDAGHWVHAERPEEFKKTVVSFLQQ
ncbi:Alpha/Beta hydrolase protein [Chytridium lagenaria]|nr:Alpha/Beta hydrolase protein [Chytridium lagenaria]